MGAGIQVRQVGDVKELEAGGIHSRQLIGPTRGSERFSAYLATLVAGYDDKSGYPNDELVYLLKGEAEIEFDGTRQTVGPGTVIFVPQGGVVRYRVLGEANEVLVFFSPPR